MSSEQPTLPEPFRAGRWWVEPRGGRIVCDDRDVRLEPRVMHLLVCLAEHPGTPLTRAILMQRVWFDCVVGGDALNSAVAKLRRALDQVPDSGVDVETVPKVGYRLRGVVTPGVSEPHSDATPTPATRITEPAIEPVEKSTDAPSVAETAASVAPRETAPRSMSRPLIWTTAAVMVAILAAAAWQALTAGGTGASAEISTRVVPLTSFNGLEVEPALSPGTSDRVAFAWKGAAQDNWDIYVQSVAGAAPLRLTSHPGSDHYPVWSPDATRIAFSRVHDGTCELRFIPAMGGLEQVIGACPAAVVNHLSWTPDGTALLVSARAALAEPFRVFRVAIDSGQAAPLTSPPPDSIGDLGARVSPDGKRLAILHSPILGVDDLYVMPTSGTGARTRVTHDDLKVHGFDWEPAGDALVFSSNRGGGFSLWRVAAGGGTPTPVVTSSDWIDAPSVGAGGARVAYEHWQTEANVYRLDLADPSAPPERVLSSTRWHWHADISPDGTRIAVVSDRSGPPEIWLASPTGDDARPATGFGGAYLHAPRWAPDSRRLAFIAHVAGTSDVYVMDADQPTPKRLTSDAAEDRSPSWSRDGRSVYYGSRATGRWEIWRTSVDGGQPQQITRHGGIAATESWDGRRLYFVKPDSHGLWELDAATATERVVVPDFHPYDRDNWAVARTEIYFAQRGRDLAPGLMRFDIATGAVSHVHTLDGVPGDSGLSVSPDGRHLYFSRIDRQNSDIHLIDRSATGR